MLLRIALVSAVLLGSTGFAVVRMTRLVEDGWEGPLGPSSEAEVELGERLVERVRFLSSTLGQHNISKVGSLDRAAQYIVDELRALGYEPELETFVARGSSVSNVIVEIPGHRSHTQTLLVGAHYDSYLRSPSANASASGTAALIELLRLRDGEPLAMTLRVVFFVNGEYPFAGTPDSGAARHARTARARGDDLVTVLCLDSLGAYDLHSGSQSFPFPLNLTYPGTGHFLAAWGDPESRDVTLQFVDAWSRVGRFPLEAGALPGWWPGMPAGDHRPFAAEGYPAVLLSDTGTLRSPYLRGAGDQPSRIDYPRFARVVSGLDRTLQDLAGGPKEAARD